MKIFINTKKMTFNEEDNLIEHEIVSAVSDEEFMGYDYAIELSDNDKFIKDTLEIEYKKNEQGKEQIESKQFKVREQKTWWNFPLYEIKDGKIVPFDYKRYVYFARTDRRMILASKINELYNPPSELKILRKTLKIILDKLNIECPEFDTYNKKIEEVVAKNPKG